MRPRYRLKKIYKWSSGLAYCTGLIASDGCLSSDGRHIDLTSKDIELLNIYREFISPQAAIGKKKNGQGQISYRVQISNVSLYDFFLSIGLTPNKSKTLGALNIPNVFYADFLRGYFDGDGSIHGFWDKRWSNSLMYYCEYTSASRPFLEWLDIRNKRNVRLEGGRLKPSRSAEALSYAKKDAKKLFLYMYYAPNLPCLNRKKEKFIDLIGQDPYANKILYARVLESGRQATLRS